MATLPSSFTRPRTLSASSSTSSASSSSSTKSWPEGNFHLTSSSNTTSQQHVLLRTRHASASNATAQLRSERRSHLSNNPFSTSLDGQGSTRSRKRRTAEQAVPGGADGTLTVPGRGVVQLETPRTTNLTIAMSKFSLRDEEEGSGEESGEEDQPESSPRNLEPESQSSLKPNPSPVSGASTTSSGSSGKSHRKRREPSSPTEGSSPAGKKTPEHPRIVIIGSTPSSTVGPGTARPTHGRSLSLDIPDLLQYRSRTSPTPSTPSPPSSALSSPALSSDRAHYMFPPSPIPSFPPFTPQQLSPELPDDTVRILQPPTQPSNGIPHLTPSNPAYFIVPSTCDKRRRTVSSAPRYRSSDEALAPRPIKKRKQAVNGALVPMFESPDPNNGRPPLEALMPTAIDVVDFIKSKGGQCHEGDVFFRFRTGENEHVRNVVNMILDEFAIHLLGPDRRRWVRLRQGVAVSPRPI